MKTKGIFIFIASLTIFFACRKTGSSGENPYDKDKGNPRETITDSSFSPSSIQGLHKNIFKPTCANSGCHDGTFEPDFRTVESSYNSLVNVAPIKADSVHKFRVLPGDADASMIMYRLTEDLGGNSGIMPLVVNPGSDYYSKKDEHLANVKAWINAGAKDFKGNTPKPVNFPPLVQGVVGLVGGSPLGRSGMYEPMGTVSGPSVDIWFSFSDDKTPQENFTGMTINFSANPGNFVPANEQSLIKASSKKTMAGIFDPAIDYWWHYSYNTSGLPMNQVIWFRITCSDGTNMNYQLPNSNSMFFLKKYFALRIQ